MAGIAGAARTSMAQKMTRKDAHSFLGTNPTANVGTQKARAHTHPHCCHSARMTLWRQREWLAALELLACPWCDKCRAQSTTALLVDLQPQSLTRTKAGKACILSAAMVRRHSYAWCRNGWQRSPQRRSDIAVATSSKNLLPFSLFFTFLLK